MKGRHFAEAIQSKHNAALASERGIAKVWEFGENATRALGEEFPARGADALGEGWCEWLREAALNSADAYQGLIFKIQGTRAHYMELAAKLK